MVKVREISDSERDYWDREIQRFEFVHPLNAYGWGIVRSVDKWSPKHLVAERDGRFTGAMMILEKRIPFTPFWIFYSPRGPVWDYNDLETLLGLLGKVKKMAINKRGIFLRIDPNICETVITSQGDKLLSSGFIHLDQRWTFWNTPRDVYRIDLTSVNDIQEFYGMLHRDTRRCIRKAGREGVKIEIGPNEEDLKVFYDIFREFSVQKGFMSRGYEYQKKLWDQFIKRGLGCLFLAKYKGRIIGGLICVLFGRRCLAMHMGTPYEYHKLQVNYAYVWESIRWAKQKGCSWYSFRGVGTTPTQEYFKRKFKPEVVTLAGYYDFPFRPWLYRVFCFLEFSVLPRLWASIIRMRKIYHKITTISGER